MTATYIRPGLLWKGDWDANAEYSKNDAVTHAGSSYRCKVAVPENSDAPAPPDDSTRWAYIAKGLDEQFSDEQRGDLIVHGPDHWENFAAGTAGQGLIAQGAGDLPAWQDVVTQAELAALSGAPDGLATLDSAGHLQLDALPALSITSVSVVASQAAQLALTAQEGDVAVRSDENETYIHNGGSADTMADWTQLATPTDLVLSVAGKTGAVTLDVSDITNGDQLANAISAVHWAPAPSGGDDTATIQALLNLGGMTQLQKGTYSVTTLSVPAGATLRGAGWFATVVKGGATGNVIEMTTLTTVEDLMVTATAPGTNRSGIDIPSGLGATLRNVLTQNVYTGVSIGAANTVSINNFIVLNTVAACQNGIVVNGAVDVFIRCATLGGSPSGVDGILVNAVSGLYMTDVAITGGKWSNALNIAPGAGQSCLAIQATDCNMDAATVSGLTLNAATATSKIYWAKFTNCEIGGTGVVSGTGPGILTTGVAGGVLDDVTFTNCEILNNKTHGVQHGFGTRFAWIGCTVGGNSKAGANTADGFNIAAGISSFRIEDCASGSLSQFVSTQANGINILAGASDHYIITGNDLSGNTTPLSDGGTGTDKRISNNLPKGADLASVYRSLRRFAARLAAGGVVSTWLFDQAIVTSFGGVQAGVLAFYFDPADHAVENKTTKLRLRFSVIANDGAPGVSFTAGLYPVASFGGAAGVNNPVVLGAVVTGSQPPQIVTPPADVATGPSAAEFAAPAAGWYVIGIVNSGTIGQTTLLVGELEVHNV